MREINYIDVLVACMTAFTGTYSIGNAIGIWRVRNGGIFVRALCAKLVAFGLWGIFVLGNVLYQWHSRSPVSGINQYMSDVDRMILTIPQAVILLFVLPRARVTTGRSK